MTSPDLPIPDSYWVEPGRLLAGEYPGRADAAAARLRLEAFLRTGVDTFLDLTHPGELRPYESILGQLARERGLELAYARIPISDHSVPTLAVMKSILDHIEAGLKAGKTMYVHCWGGVGRTGTTVGCYLIRGGLTGPQALERLAGWWSTIPKRAYFPRSPETDEQVQFILNWQETGSPTA